MPGWETKPRGDPLVLADELEGYSTAQLLAEIGRRERALREAVEGPVLCDGCVHRRFWKQRRDPPDDWSPCSLLFGVDFKLPEDYPDASDDWGFYRPGGCPERQEPPPPAPPPAEPPPPPRGGKPVAVPVRPA